MGSESRRGVRIHRPHSALNPECLEVLIAPSYRPKSPKGHFSFSALTSSLGQWSARGKRLYSIYVARRTVSTHTVLPLSPTRELLYRTMARTHTCKNQFQIDHHSQKRAGDGRKSS